MDDITEIQRGEARDEARIPLHERLHIGMCLALVGGFLDIYTYLLRGEVFANAQTGNMVLMSLAVSRGEWRRAAYYLVPIFTFALGVLGTEHLKRRNAVSWQRFVLLLEAMILFAVGFYPTEMPHIAANATISFVCSMQVNSFRRVFGTPYATTMCTGNLRSASEQFFLFVRERDRAAGRRCFRYCGVIGCFCIGAAAGGVLSQLLGSRAIWCCCAMLLLVFGLLGRDARMEREGDR